MYDDNDLETVKLYLLVLDSSGIFPTRKMFSDSIINLFASLIGENPLRKQSGPIFNLLEEVYREYNLSPSCIWNADEVGVSIEQRELKLMTHEKIY